MTAPIRVFVIDDQALLCEGLQSLWIHLDSIKIVGVTSDAATAVEQVVLLQPDIVLLDVGMPHIDGIAATRLILERSPGTRVLILTTIDDTELVIGALRAGAGGYILKDMSADQIARAVDAAHHGTISLAPRVVRNMIAADRGEQSPDVEAYAMPAALDALGREHLSDRELKVLRLAARGLTNREIGASLFVTEGTVKNHISAMLGKLQVRGRTQAVVVAKELGLL